MVSTVTQQQASSINRLGGVNPTAASSMSSSEQKCTCCPYGYHIDLDFLRFLDSLYSGDSVRNNLRRVRHQRTSVGNSQSFEGFFSDDEVTRWRNYVSSSTTRSPLLSPQSDVSAGHVTTDEILLEIDTSMNRTLSSINEVDSRVIRKKKPPRPLPAKARGAVEGSGFEAPRVRISTSEPRHVEERNSSTITVTSVELRNDDALRATTTASGTASKLGPLPTTGDITPTALQTIRDQLVVSLQRMRQLEDQVRVIPTMEDEISRLRDENARLRRAMTSSSGGEHDERSSIEVESVRTFRRRDGPGLITVELPVTVGDRQVRSIGVGDGDVFSRSLDVGSVHRDFAATGQFSKETTTHVYRSSAETRREFLFGGGDADNLSERTSSSVWATRLPAKSVSCTGTGEGNVQDYDSMFYQTIGCPRCSSNSVDEAVRSRVTVSEERNLSEPRWEVERFGNGQFQDVAVQCLIIGGRLSSSWLRSVESHRPTTSFTTTVLATSSGDDGVAIEPAVAATCREQVVLDEVWNDKLAQLLKPEFSKLLVEESIKEEKAVSFHTQPTDFSWSDAFGKLDEQNIATAVDEDDKKSVELEPLLDRIDTENSVGKGSSCEQNEIGPSAENDGNSRQIQLKLADFSSKSEEIETVMKTEISEVPTVPDETVLDSRQIIEQISSESLGSVESQLVVNDVVLESSMSDIDHVTSVQAKEAEITAESAKGVDRDTTIVESRVVQVDDVVAMKSSSMKPDEQVTASAVEEIFIEPVTVTSVESSRQQIVVSTSIEDSHVSLDFLVEANHDDSEGQGLEVLESLTTSDVSIDGSNGSPKSVVEVLTVRTESTSVPITTTSVVVVSDDVSAAESLELVTISREREASKAADETAIQSVVCAFAADSTSDNTSSVVTTGETTETISSKDYQIIITETSVPATTSSVVVDDGSAADVLPVLESVTVSRECEASKAVDVPFETAIQPVVSADAADSTLENTNFVVTTEETTETTSSKEYRIIITETSVPATTSSVVVVSDDVLAAEGLELVTISREREASKAADVLFETAIQPVVSGDTADSTSENNTNLVVTTESATETTSSKGCRIIITETRIERQLIGNAVQFEESDIDFNRQTCDVERSTLGDQGGEFRHVPDEASSSFYNEKKNSGLQQRPELSEEMLAACSVYAQWLVDSTKVSLDSKKSSVEMIQKYWFQAAGRKSSAVAEVLLYLRSFERILLPLLFAVVNMADQDMNTVLHYAVSHGNIDVVDALLDTGVCDIRRQNRAGYTPVMLAALLILDTQQHRNVIKRLFSIGDVNVQSATSGQTALMLAASHGRLEMVQLLLECGADVNARDDDGSTALMCACEHGYVDIVQLLLAHPQCDSTLSDVDGSTALSIAMDEGYRDIGVLLYAHMNTGRMASSLEADQNDVREESDLTQGTRRDAN